MKSLKQSRERRIIERETGLGYVCVQGATGDGVGEEGAGGRDGARARRPQEDGDAPVVGRDGARPKDQGERRAHQAMRRAHQQARLGPRPVTAPGTPPADSDVEREQHETPRSRLSLSRSLALDPEMKRFYRSTATRELHLGPAHPSCST